MDTIYSVGTMGGGAALHLVDGSGILCNRWGSTNGVVRRPSIIGTTATGATATCKRCAKLAAL